MIESDGLARTDELEASIRVVEDFPQPGVKYRDMTGILEDPDQSEQMFAGLVAKATAFSGDAIVCIESRGFLLGSVVAQHISVPLILARKAGKLAFPTYSSGSYELEYGKDSLEVQKNSALHSAQKVILLDDVIASGGTALACCKLLSENFGIPRQSILVLTFIELAYLDGAEVIRTNGYNFETIVSLKA